MKIQVRVWSLDGKKGSKWISRLLCLSIVGNFSDSISSWEVPPITLKPQQVSTFNCIIEKILYSHSYSILPKKMFWKDCLLYYSYLLPFDKVSSTFIKLIIIICWGYQQKSTMLYPSLNAFSWFDSSISSQLNYGIPTNFRK